MTDGQLRVFALVLVLIGLEVWLHWSSVKPWLSPKVSKWLNAPSPGAWSVPPTPGVQP